MKLKPIEDQVVAIVGASSGIGRLTALEFARRGARVVVSSRDREGLDTLVTEITQAGGRAISVVADAADRAQVAAIAEAASTIYGGLDTWVHNAGVAVYAPFEQLTPEEFDRVIAVTLNSHAYGAMAALPLLRKRGGGALIHVSSIEAEVSAPFHSAYSAAKHGVAGLLNTLRIELEKEDTPISVTNVMPAAIDTPFFDHSRAKLGVKPKALPPVYDPARVARAILKAAEHPKREMIVGTAGHLLVRLHRWAPGLADAWTRTFAFRGQLSKEPRPRDYPGNLFVPIPGDIRIRAGESLLARLGSGPVVKTLASVATLGALALAAQQAR